MDDIEKRVLSQMRSRLVKEVVVTESFLCAFCDSNILDDQMTRLLKTETNYESRAAKLLDMLPSRGSRAFMTLMEILEITNPWLAEKMKSALHDERNKDAKINLHPSVSQSASIEGYGQNRLHIDADVKERAMRFIKTNLNHLSDIEQRGVEKWLADELQRERRRQQFRAPHNLPRNPSDFHASKECQTDTSNMDLIELYEEMSIYLHGVDYVQINVDFSFKKLAHKITELLTRTRKLDALFLNCIEKFDDPDKYSVPLPELIDRTIGKERNLSQVNNDDKRLIQKFSEERDMAKRQVKRLEDELDKVLQRQVPTNKPQEIQLRNRQNINVRYSLLLPDSSQQQQPLIEQAKAEIGNETKHVPTNQSVHVYQNDIVNSVMPSAAVNMSEESKMNNVPITNGVTNRLTSTQTNGVHRFENPANITANTDNVYRKGMLQHHVTGNYTGKDGSIVTMEMSRLRRHNSEESLKIALSKEEAETVSMAYLHSEDFRGRRKSYDGFNNVPVSQPSGEPAKKQPPTLPVKNTRNDIHNKMLRMLSGASKTNIVKVKRSESEKAVGSHGVKAANPGKIPDPSAVFKGNPNLRSSYDNIAAMSRKAEQIPLDSDGVTYGNVTSRNPYRFLSNNHSERVFHQQQQQQPNGQHAFQQQQSNGQHAVQQQRGSSHTSRQEGFRQYQMLQHRTGNLFYEEVISEPRSYAEQHTGPSSNQENKKTLIYPRDYDITEHYYSQVSRGDSIDRQPVVSSAHGQRPPSRRGSRELAGVDYSSDSEIIHSGIRKTTSSPDRAKGRVRFASPVSRSTKPMKKGHGKTKPGHYQSDTMSATMRRMKKV